MYSFEGINWEIYTKKIKGVYNLICNNIIAFDIETSSAFIDKNGEVINFDFTSPKKTVKMDKVTLCYIWQCSIDGLVYFGRTLEEFEIFLRELTEVCPAKKIIYIHNFQYEFNYLRNVFNFQNVFARDTRKPMKAELEEYNVEFRCSYYLTNMSLKTWAEQKNLPVMKSSGEEFDYNAIRTPKTKLTKEQLKYCYNDVMVMYWGLLEYKEKYKHIADIPLTQTGELRKELYKVMRNEKSYKKHITSLIPIEVEEMRELNRVFMGGWTHANFIHTGDIIENVYSYDLASSYPTVMLLKKFPYSKFIEKPFDEKYRHTNNYSYIIEFECDNVMTKLFNTFISFSKVQSSIGVVKDNGRIQSAEHLHLTLTNVDYEIFEEVYSFDNLHIISFKVAVNRYLNNTLRKFILELYSNKTQLKGIPEKEPLYMKSKQYINALFGMSCTRTITDGIIFDGDNWKRETLTEEIFHEKTEKQMRNLAKNVIAFSTGVWVSAYGRENLWKAIREIDEDVIYCDTDSVKFIGNHKTFFKKYNENIMKEIHKVAKDLQVDPKMFYPADKKGKEQIIGIFDFEGKYDKFRTWGSKKYAFEKDGVLNMTVSGVRKSAVSQIKSIEEFDIGLIFDEEHTKKVTMIYTDNQKSCIFNKGQYDEYECSYQYGVHATPTTYKLDITDEYNGLISEGDIDLLLLNKPDNDIIHII